MELYHLSDGRMISMKMTGSYAQSAKTGSGNAIAVSMTKNSDERRLVLVGSDGGAVLRGSLEESALRHRRPKLTGCKMKWSKAAIKWILNVHSSQRSKVIQAVEEKATRFNKK
eukprot:6507989-Ditylum_brightwellii.AAC.1